MFRIRHFEFLCRSMHIEPMVNRFRVFYQLHCSRGFYSFAQRSPAKKILLMTFWGTKDIVVETMKTLESEIWYQDLKDISSIELPERALVATGMSLHWCEDKPVYMEGDKIRNFAFPRDEDLAAQPSTGAAVTIAPKKTDAAKAQSSKAKNVKEEKKGTRRFSDSWCDYIVVSDTLEGLAPVVVRKPKAKPRDIVDIPASNPDDPIDLESSPEPLLRTKAVKRKIIEVEASAKPAKKVPKRKIGKKRQSGRFYYKASPR
ncbi:hypothetical protein Hanom_Chr10g00938231 [Helianthus anomalus]